MQAVSPTGGRAIRSRATSVPCSSSPAAAGGLAPTAPGVSYPGDAVRIDLNAAGATPTALPAGRYSINVAPSLVGTTAAFYD